MKKTNFLFIFLLLTFIFTSLAEASRVTPVRFDMTIAPGTSKDFTLQLMGSKGEYSQSLLIYASDLSMARNGALGFDRIDNLKSSCVKWIKLEKEKATLFEEQKMPVKFQVNIPFDATPGEYYAIIMVEPEKYTNVKDKVKPIMLQMKTRVAVVIVLDVPGRVYEKKGEATEANVIKTDSLVRITSTFKNSGNLHLDVMGEAIVRSADGRISFGKFDLQATGSSKKETFILPGSMRDFTGSLDRLLPSGDYKVDVSYNYGYDFKKANKSQKFTVVRKTPIKEDAAEFLAIGTKELRLQIPEGGRKTEVVRLTNLDYRPLSVDITSDGEGVTVSPNNLVLRPGEVRNVMATVSVPKYIGGKMESTITLKSERGLSSKIKVLASADKDKLVVKETKNEI